MKKKLYLILTLFIMMVTLVSCLNPETQTYKITYYSDGEIIEHTPDTYQKGETVELIPLVKEGYSFLGWYENYTFSGEKIDKLDSTYAKDVILYARWEKNQIIVPSSPLEEAINNMDNYNYSFSYSSADGEDNYSCDYEFYNGSLKSQYESEYGIATEYIALVNDVYYYYGDNLDGTFYSIPETDYYFSYYIAYMDIVDFEMLNSDDFILNKDTYVLKDKNKTNEVVNNLIGEGENENFTNIEISIENKVITKIFLESVYTYEGVDYDYEYTITFTKHHQTSFELPEVENLSTTMTVQEVINASDGESVLVKGYVCGIVGNNFYVQDYTGGIYIYLGSTSVEGLELGTEVIVQGIKETYKGLVEVTNVSSVDLTGYMGDEISSVVLETVDNTVLNNWLCRLVKYNSLTYVSGSLDLNKDSSITLSDGMNQVTLFISKHISTSKKEEVASVINNLKVGSTISLDNLVVGCFNNPQLVVTETTTINEASGEIKGIRLDTNYSTIRVPLNTSFENAIENLVVTFVKSNNTSEVVDLNDCELIHQYDATIVATYPLIITYGDFSVTVDIVVNDGNSAPSLASSETKKLEDILSTLGEDPNTGEIYGITRGLPSIGNPKILVIPIAFTDYPAPSNMQSTLQTAFFGNSSDTGWESLSSYYYKSSYGKLSIEGTVLPVYNTGKKSTSYKYNQTADADILKAALNYFDSQINYADYDSDKDGYIDGIYLVYTAEIDYYDSESLWWAFTTEYTTDDYEYYDGVEADFYLFAGYDFIYEDLASGKNIKYNMETFIHESGHLLGLDDYYDFDSSVGPAGGIGGGDMMDANVGDHNAFSKIILGWTTPLIMGESDATVTLGSFGKTGDCLIIAKNWNESYFSEYYIIDFYTPDGLNEIEKGNSGLFSVSGIRIYHIDATLNKATEVGDIWSIYASNNGETSHKLIELVEADRANDIIKDKTSENDDLFQVGQSFTWATWYDGSDAGFTLQVISINNNEATISITYK